MAGQCCLLGIGCWLVDMVIYLRYFTPFRLRYYKSQELIHGKFLVENNNSVFLELVSAVVFAPVFEEFIFHGPILLLVQHNQAAWSLAGVLVLGAMFGILHRGEIIGFYNDGTKAYYCNADWLFIAFGGLCFGFVTIIGASLWPAIIAHGLWNSSVFLGRHSQKFNRVEERCTILLQR